MTSVRIFGIIVIGISAVVALVFSVGYAIGFRVNLTESAPVGLWRTQSVSSVARGDFVEVCPPELPVVSIMAERGYLEPGDCPIGTLPLLKPVAAVSGDTVIIRQSYPAEVNGYVLPSTLPMSSVPGWPDGNYMVDEGYIWLLSTYSEGSFDSRYFGPVSLADVRGRAVPVLVKGNPEDMVRIAGGKHP